ncbi:hypothetical protein [Umezakia ovalisporum]|jgi:DNA-binding helix-hairpin-helix protein with protein kinase domain|uniref:Uncharacterized protein n=2 Tax=Umezakia ovalisporum TaxID=75695 RepID=A0AA43GVH1_9CYAN|nr:hypothetical protein [Umezakia ovalisporum]MBI1240104.1 hypothetical protein [Nostoc sp. RI_552]MDH6057016.1 hypothetical protein [Umezakia ovalisporum FSS-43]MDH6062379.1 hypothetical protein [Umezakia ovalisporum FSS-62]MDH6068466.1 hypothetical protein [Umezakia ovalisporum APH033B]MDH6071207.1 hypothetical protein [Umezakia ovalisporum CobakiLakeA]
MAESIDKIAALTQQWLAEIQSLKQQLAEQQHEGHTAWESAQKWRKLYNTEAEQRRTDANLAQQVIGSLKAEIHQLKGLDSGIVEDRKATTVAEQEIKQIKSLEELQCKLIAVTKERDRLLQALKTEQEKHAQTRKSLTTALGDAIGSARQRAGG